MLKFIINRSNIWSSPCYFIKEIYVHASKNQLIIHDLQIPYYNSSVHQFRIPTKANKHIYNLSILNKEIIRKKCIKPIFKMA